MQDSKRGAASDRRRESGASSSSHHRQPAREANDSKAGPRHDSTTTGKALAGPRVSGMSIPVKFTLVVAATIAALTLGFGATVYVKTSTALEHEIDQFGATVALTLSAVHPACWSPEHGTYRDVVAWIDAHVNDETATILARQYGITYDKNAREAYEALIRPRMLQKNRDSDSGLSDAESQRLRESAAVLEASDAARRKFNRTILTNAVRFQGSSGQGQFGFADVVDLLVRDDRVGEGVFAVKDSGADKFREGATEKFVLETPNGPIETQVNVTHGTLGNGQVARAYLIPIRDERGQRTHSVRVFVSEEKIQAKLKSLLVSICEIAGLITAIGAAISLVVTKRMTRPVMTLVEDIEIVTGGDLDHRVRAHTSDEIGLIARTFDKMVRAIKEKNELEAKSRVLSHEMSVASEVQSKLLPDRPPDIPGFEIDGAFRPSREVGGNYYDFLPFGPDRFGIIVASVPTKGLPAALTMAMARSLFRVEAERCLDPIATLKAVNRHLARDIRKGLYMAAVLAVVDGTTKKLHFCSAGQLPLLLVRNENGSSKVQALKSSGIALGLDSGPVFDNTLEEKTIDLQSGDRVVLFSEGALKVKNEKSEELGEARFRELVGKLASRNSSAFVNLVMGNVDKWRGSAPPTDDVTVATLKVM